MIHPAVCYRQGMKLRTYMAVHKLTQAAMAELVGVKQPVLQRWLTGRIPETRFVQRIHTATAGKVSLFDWEEPNG